MLSGLNARKLMLVSSAANVPTSAELFSPEYRNLLHRNSQRGLKSRCCDKKSFTVLIFAVFAFLSLGKGLFLSRAIASSLRLMMSVVFSSDRGNISDMVISALFSWDQRADMAILEGLCELVSLRKR